MKKRSGLPAWARRIGVVNLRPNDVVIIESADLLSYEMAKRIGHMVEEALPGRRVLVLSKGLSLKAVRES